MDEVVPLNTGNGNDSDSESDHAADRDCHSGTGTGTAEPAMGASDRRGSPRLSIQSDSPHLCTCQALSSHQSPWYKQKSFWMWFCVTIAGLTLCFVLFVGDVRYELLLAAQQLLTPDATPEQAPYEEFFLQPFYRYPNIIKPYLPPSPPQPAHTTLRTQTPTYYQSPFFAVTESVRGSDSGVSLPTICLLLLHCNNTAQIITAKAQPSSLTSTTTTDWPCQESCLRSSFVPSCQLFHVISDEDWGEIQSSNTRIHSNKNVTDGNVDTLTGPAVEFAIVRSGHSLEYAFSYLPELTSALRYTNHHRYHLYVRIASKLQLKSRHSAFSKVLAVRDVLNLGYNFVTFTDLDMSFPIEYSWVPLSHFVSSSAYDMVFQAEREFCSCVMIYRNTMLSRYFLSKVWFEGLRTYTRAHTWEQKAFTHVLNQMLHAKNGYMYNDDCYLNWCQPFGLQRYGAILHDINLPSNKYVRTENGALNPLRIYWELDWAPFHFVSENEQYNVSSPQLHRCYWEGCSDFPAVIDHKHPPNWKGFGCQQWHQ